MAIIGVSGRKQSSKDTLGKIIQYLISESLMQPNNETSFLKFLDEHKVYKMSASNFREQTSNWKIVKFADTLKSMMCIILAEPDFISKWEANDNNYRDEELGEEWDRYYLCTKFNERCGGIYSTIKELEKGETNLIHETTGHIVYGESLTRRKLLQLLGTDCGRNIIHPNIWCMTTMVNYKPIGYHPDKNAKIVKIDDIHQEFDNYNIPVYPNWIITDVRFPNEVKAIEDRGGFIIRLNRDDYNLRIRKAKARRSPTKVQGYPTNAEIIGTPEHESETALDNYKAKYTVDNNGTIKKLIVQVKNILIKEEVL